MVSPEGTGRLELPITFAAVPTTATLNLGSAFNTLYTDEADNFDLEVRSLPSNRWLRTPFGTIDSYASAVPVLIGNVRIPLDFLLIPRGEASSEDYPTFVSLGINAFTNVDLELDFSQRQAHLYSQDHCEGEVVHWTDTFTKVPLMRGPSQEAFLVMELDGQRIETALGTMYSGSVLRDLAARELFAIEPSEEPTLAAGGPRYEFMSLTAEGIEVMGLRIALQETPNSCRLQRRKGREGAAGFTNCGNQFPLVLGMDVIRQMHAYFATREGMLYFTAADATRSPQ